MWTPKDASITPFFSFSRSTKSSLEQYLWLASRFNDDFSNLIILALEGNLLSSVPFIKQIAANLILLDLSHNSIDSLEKMYNVQFLRLHTLHLGFNSVRHISLSGLYMPKLYALHLRHNLLVTMEPVDEILMVSKDNIINPMYTLGTTHGTVMNSFPASMIEHIINEIIINLVSHIQTPHPRFPLLLSISWCATHKSI